jgi:hypothetical protein
MIELNVINDTRVFGPVILYIRENRSRVYELVERYVYLQMNNEWNHLHKSGRKKNNDWRRGMSIYEHHMIRSYGIGRYACEYVCMCMLCIICKCKWTLNYDERITVTAGVATPIANDTDDDDEDEVGVDVDVDWGIGRGPDRGTNKGEPVIDDVLLLLV